MKTVVILLTVGLLYSFALLGKTSYTSMQLRNANAKLNEELMQAELEIGRAKTKFGNANKYIKTLEKKVQDEIKERDAAITRVGWFEGQLKTANKIIKGQKKDQKIVYIDREVLIEPTNTVPKFERGMLYQAIGPKSLIMLGRVDQKFQDHRLKLHVIIEPTPNAALRIPVNVGYELSVNLLGELVETLLPSGGINHYLTLWETKDKEKLGKVLLQDFQVVVNDQRKLHFMFVPRLDIGITPFWNLINDSFDAGGSFGVSVLGVGLTKKDLSWRFLRLSLEVKNDIGLGFSPFVFNVGSLASPILTNVWIGPNLVWFVNNGIVPGLFLGGII